MNYIEIGRDWKRCQLITLYDEHDSKQLPIKMWIKASSH